MLLSIQFPIADARRFLDKPERLGTPIWPHPSPDSEFIRFFGAIRNRPLGGLAGWIGEDPICKANRALLLSKNPSLIEGHKPAHVAFRRFYFDGWAVGKYEIGFHNRLRSFPAQLEKLESHLLRLPIRVRNSTGTPIHSELGQGGKHLARLYLRASTPTSSTIAEKDEWQVRSGTPLLYLELRDPEDIAVPKEAKSIELHNWPSGLKLFHYGIPYRGGKIYMWILKHGISTKQANLTRTLRLYLLRLHAEYECLRLMLQSIANRDIQITRGTDTSNDLQKYLDKAITRITDYEAKTGAINEDIAKLARQSNNMIRAAQLDILLENVNDYRRYLSEKIEKQARQDAAIINYGNLEVNMDNREGNTYNITNTQGILNIESTLTNVSQTVNNIPNMDQSSREELKQLIEQLSAALKKAPTDKMEDAEAVAELAKDVVEKASKDKPNKSTLQVTLAGLKQAAENMAKVLPDVLPIAMQIAGVVAKASGIG